MQIHIIFDFGGGNAASLEGVSSFGATSSALYLIAIASTPVARLVSNLQRTLKWPRCDYVLNIKNNSTTSKRANAHDWLRDERTLASSSPCSTSSLRPGRQRPPAGTSPTPARRRAGPTQRSGVRVGARARSRSDFGRPDEPARRSRVGRSVLSRLTPAPRGRPTASPICFGSQHF